MNRFTVNGVTDERDTCDCCGRTNLKRVVCLTDHTTDEDVFFGTTCAARAMKITVKEAKARVNAAEAAKREADRREHAARHAAKGRAWTAHLISVVGHEINDWQGTLDIHAMIGAAGGWAAAREGFNWNAA